MLQSGFQLILEDRNVESDRPARRPLTPVLASLIGHGLLMMVLILHALSPRPETEQKAPTPEPESTREVARLFLPPRMAEPAPPARRMEPTRPTAVPPKPSPPPVANDKIRIGNPTKPIDKPPLLRPDDPVSSTRGGDGAPPATAAPTSAPTEPPAAERASARALRAAGASEAPTGISESMHRLENKWERSGTGLGFGSKYTIEYGDPQGADFGEWIEHLRRELYRNWIAPQAALMGFKGRVTVHFVVGRDGTLLRGEISQGSGTVSLDRAAKNAVLGSRMRPLPPDYGSSEFELSVTFYYNEGPRPS
jgi:TonB family protein